MQGSAHLDLARPRPVRFRALKIRLNGDPYELPAPLTVTALLGHLSIDPRRVAVERNQVVVKRTKFDEELVGEGDAIEIVNFVGGGAV